ncbi:MAG: DUF5060 domain-containing protein [Singulisphaera sp.]
MMSHLIPVILASLSVAAPPDPGGEVEVPRYGVFEQSLRHSGDRANPYATLAATAELTAPDGVAKRRIPLFWDGGRDWKLRFSPDRSGTWSWAVRSDDPGLDGQSGRFRVVESDRKGGLGRMEGSPYHFRRQDGTPFWFLGDTGWALFTTGAEEKHTRGAVERYIDARADQGFNVIHAMLISEAGWGNDGGPAFEDLGAERINPGYWREVDRTLAYLNGKGIVGGLVLAWSDKGRNPNNWRDFPSQEARERYARYVAARYSASDVYFIVGGEWDLEIAVRPVARRAETAIHGDRRAVADADPHGRLIGIHPGGNGSVEEFADAPGMDFGDYQQIYNDLHAAILKARATTGRWSTPSTPTTCATRTRTGGRTSPTARAWRRSATPPGTSPWRAATSSRASARPTSAATATRARSTSTRRRTTTGRRTCSTSAPCSRPWSGGDSSPTTS